MALQTSGAISLNQIHIEAGGSSGTTASLNDADIRGLIGKASGATMSFSEWYGASATLDTQTVTAGYAPAGQYNNAAYGFSTALPITGSCSDGTSNVVSNSIISKLCWIPELNVFAFQVDSSATNSGFSAIKIGSQTFNRTSATYTNTGVVTYWQWSTSTNPFPTTGANYTVTWV